MYLAGMPTLAVSAVGLDRPGIIAAVAERLVEQLANAAREISAGLGVGR